MAYRIYVRRPEIAAEAWPPGSPDAHRVLTNKYYVDELYGATVVRGHDRQRATALDVRPGGRGRRRERLGLDDAPSAWISGPVSTSTWSDGLVNLVGLERWGRRSYVLRRVQTGLIQNYALLMLVGVFAFDGVLFTR